MKPNMNAVNPRSVKIDTSSSTLPTSYTIAATSLKLSDVAYADHLMVINETGSRIAINAFTSDASNAPSNGDGEVYCFGNGITAFDEIAVAQSLYVRSDSGSPITSGIITIMLW